MGRLVLTRTNDQGIWVGDSHVKVSIEGNRVRLVIEAPDDVPIRRDELQPLETRHHANRDQRPQTRRRRVAG